MTMKNALAKIAELIARQESAVIQCDICSYFSKERDSLLEQACSEAREVWASAAFSVKGKDKLRRYFSYQLQELTTLLERTNARTAPELGDYLVRLADHLCTFFAAYIDKQVFSPPAFTHYKLAQLKEKAKHLEALLQDTGINPELHDCLASYLRHYFVPTCRRRVSFGSLDYLELLMDTVSDLLESTQPADADKAMEDSLLALNFNRLEFFNYMIGRFRSATKDLTLLDQQTLLLQNAALLQPNIHYNKMYYDPLLPPVTVMYKGWLQDEALAVAERLRSQPIIAENPTEKIGMNLSVAELACMVRLFFETGLFLEPSIKEILQLIPLHFSAKRQPHITGGSFSSKYYSSEQKAAAKIKALLLKMIAWLNKHYFPVVVAASAVIAAH
jgi:hypothetical protein